MDRAAGRRRYLRRLIHYALVSDIWSREASLPGSSQCRQTTQEVRGGVFRMGRPVGFPTLRFRGKIVAGFTVVLAISAASLGIAYLGFARVSAGVSSYRSSVSQA